MANEATDVDEEKILKRIPFETAAAAFVLGALAALIFEIKAGVFVLAGGLFSAAGFLHLRRVIERILGTDRGKAIRAGIALYFLRLILLVAVFLIIILFFAKMVLAFAAGFSAVILIFLIEAAGALLRVKPWKT